MIREAYDTWRYLLTNEGNSAAIASKLTAIGTGVVVAVACFLLLCLVTHHAAIFRLIGRALRSRPMQIAICLSIAVAMFVGLALMLSKGGFSR